MCLRINSASDFPKASGSPGLLLIQNWRSARISSARRTKDPTPPPGHGSISSSTPAYLSGNELNSFENDSSAGKAMRTRILTEMSKLFAIRLFDWGRGVLADSQLALSSFRYLGETVSADFVAQVATRQAELSSCFRLHALGQLHRAHD